MNALRTLVRWALFGLCAFASAYALLCRIPFTWTNFISSRAYPSWAAVLLRVHPWLFAGLVALACAALMGAGRRKAALLWGLPHAGLALGWLLRPLLPSLVCDTRSFVWALALWAPTLSWELVLLAGAPRPAPSLLEDARRLSLAPFAAALVLFVGGAFAALLAGFPGTPVGTLLALGRSALLHLSFAAALAAVLSALRALPRARPGLRRAELPLLGLVFAAAAFFAVRRTVLDPLSVRGLPAVLYGAAAALALTFAALASLREGEESPSRPVRALLLLGAAALAPAAARKVFAVDWDFMLQTLSVYGAWLLALAAALRLPWERLPLRRPPSDAWKTAAACALLLWATDGGLRAADPLARRLGLRLRPALQRLAAEEPSTRALYRLLRDGSRGDDFFQHLQLRTNLPRSVSVRIPERGLRAVGSAPSPRPDIFIFVVDSLRADYLGAYDPKVRFTPAFDAFARESVVFRRAFTSYGGTGLSEPAIWTGARLPHQQYPPGLRRMNLLEKLVEDGGYLPLITLDSVLKSVLTPPTGTRDLDERVVENYKLCGTLSELESLLPTLGRERPLFVYSQPQDIHVSVIDREGRGAAADPAYPGFHAPYAARVARMDACFGRFVAALKRSGRWENSVVVLTADHGDSLGEGGRWGHAFTVYPEVLKVPLILHAPARLLAGRVWSADAPALLLDVAPTLAALLGREPDSSSPLAGRPLLRPAGEAPAPRPEELVASSYAPAYGLLLDDARRLYIADGVSYQELLFELDGTAAGRPLPLDPEAAARGRAGVRAGLDRIDAAYGLHPD